MKDDNARKPIPLFPYTGSKWKMMPKLLPLFPAHEHYVSVFGGSAADILRKPRSRMETFNEIDGHINSLFAVLMDSDMRVKLMDRITHAPARSRKMFLEALEVLKKPDGDPVNAAWAFLVAACQSTNQLHPLRLLPCNWGYVVQPRNGRMIRLPNAMNFVAKRFRRVQLSNWDWREVVQRLDSKTTFFFADPPYWPVTDKAKYYAHQMTFQEHKLMLETFKTVQSKVMLCGYRNELYDEKLTGWRKVEFVTKTTMNVNGKRAKRTEVVWMNY